MRTLEDEIIFRIKEQIGIINTFINDIDKLALEQNKDSEIIVELKKTNPNLSATDVKDRLVNIAMISWRIYIMKEQLEKHHLTILREFETVANLMKVDLQLNQSEKELLEKLPIGIQLLFIPTNEGLKPFDEKVYKELEQRQLNAYSSDESIEEFFKHF